MMKNCKLKQLSLAVGLVLGSAGAMMQSAQAVIVSPDNLGQALIFPYYTVNGGWNSLLHVTNTSGRVVAVKVRFRESYNSRDVFDFDIILSPFDVWTGWVASSAAGPTLFTEDKSCTVGSIPLYPTGEPFPAPISYVSPYNDGGPTDASRMNEGYVEMIMMGATPVVAGYNSATDLGTVAGRSFAQNYPLASGAIHSAGNAPTGCAALVAAFQSPAQLQETAANLAAAPVPGNVFSEFRFLEDANALPLNILKGQYSLVNGEQGLNAVGLPTALANFHVGTAAELMALQLEATGATEVNTAFPSAATVPYNRSWHEPSLFSSNLPGAYSSTSAAGSALNIGIITVSAANNVADLNAADADNVSSALARSNIINEWSRRANPAAGWVTSTDWVVTFPTKHFYADFDATGNAAGPPITTANPFAGRNAWRGNIPAFGTAGISAPFSNFFVNVNPSPASTARNGQSCDTVSFTIRDREEQAVVNGGFSPGAVARFCYEANTLTFNGDGVLGSPAALNGSINSSYLYGWLNVGLPNPTTTGLPVVGFSITTRSDQTSGLLSEAGLTDHSYTRPVNP